MILGYRKLELHKICESTILLTGHLTFGTVYLTMLSSRIQLIHLNLDLINSGNTQMLYMISKPIFMEPEAEAFI